MSRDPTSNDSEQFAEPVPNTDELAKRIMQRVAAQLENGRGYEAVRLFLDAVSHEAMPKYVSLGVWVAQTLHEDALHGLVTALAHFPCFGCKDGYESCALCGGTGFSSVRQVCAICIGFGVARCDFCNASGLATYNVIPQDFRYGVFQRRVAFAIRHVRKLVGADCETSSNTSHQISRLRQRVLDLNKLLGVMENALLAGRQIVQWQPEQSAGVVNVTAACRSSARLAHETLHQMLKRLAESHDRAAKTACGSAAEAAADLGEYYDVLHGTDRYANTLLSHPFLFTSDATRTQSAADLAPPRPSLEVGEHREPSHD